MITIIVISNSGKKYEWMLKLEGKVAWDMGHLSRLKASLNKIFINYIGEKNTVKKSSRHHLD